MICFVISLLTFTFKWAWEATTAQRIQLRGQTGSHHRLSGSLFLCSALRSSFLVLQCKPTALATASPRSSTDFLQVHILQKPFSPYLPVLRGYRILTPGPRPPPNDTRVSLDGAQASSYTSPKLTSPLYFWKARLLPSSHSNLSSPNAKLISNHSKPA